jgi:cysteine desulfurase
LSGRVYLDWNATAPLRPEARAAMLAAMDAVGNPSSVHAEGRAARAIVERARRQVAALVDAEPEQVIFTSGATEAAAMAEPEGWTLVCPLEHDVLWENFGGADESEFPARPDGLADLDKIEKTLRIEGALAGLALVAAQNETGVIQPVDRAAAMAREARGRARFVTDAVQAAGRIPFSFSASGADFALVSSHKLGGGLGAGACIAKEGHVGRWFQGFMMFGPQERGQRAGTENVIGIAGFGAAAEAALRDLEAGVWQGVRARRDRLEARLSEASPDTIWLGAHAPRLPNTSCFATPGWRGETQVIQLDLAGFAVSAGSACSSGKTGPSRALRAMGLDEETAASAIRVSIGPTTTDQEIDRFAETWIGLRNKRRLRAA